MKKKQSKTWNSWFKGNRISEDFMNGREQHVLPMENLEKPEDALFQFDQDVRSKRGRAEKNTNQIKTITTKSTTVSSNTSL